MASFEIERCSPPRLTDTTNILVAVPFAVAGQVDYCVGSEERVKKTPKAHCEKTSLENVR